jgi:hypothetical protein
MTWNPITDTWVFADGTIVSRASVLAGAHPDWWVAARRPYPGLLERRAMEYLGTPDRVASGRERLGE